MTILFSNEKPFDLDGIYNSENNRIWVVNREEANRRGGKKTARKVCRKSDTMVSRMLRGRCVRCSVWKRHSPSSSLHQGSTACCSTTRKQ